ncbi:serine/threonine protein kinase [Antricoccus suffuscus]|uniref:non-specific serine/threonine protein kinase n=1 Tax=Antricoccus suffuscus TaxID=1629062 RepID=A0A2T1A4Z1_9ACTN|nr:serine/threonine-protein kinase [Antricoccus suffuscus]PRZ43408.1 serine/threonine protein kinase [Antricoccus suffuscus]
MSLQDVPGQQLPRLADFEVVRLIGDGNHGRFYLARPPARLGIGDEYVAVKIFAGECTEDDYRRGARELRAFAAVESPYLATVYDAVLEDSFLYAMEYFSLGSLASPARPLERSEILRALEHAARAVDALHEAGLAHGDIKPANVMLTDSGAKLSDLGLARVFNEGAAMTGMAPETSVEYVDPTLLLGDPPSRATDLWGLGATMHRSLSGAGLYGEIPKHQPLLAIRKVQSTPPAIDSSLTDGERAIVARCLAPLGERYETAGELADAIGMLRA